MSVSIYEGHRFFPLDSQPRVKKFASFDTEDDTRGNVLLTTFHDGEVPRVYKKTTQALEFLYNLSLAKPLYLVAHNLEYDLCNLFKGRLRCLEWRFFGGSLMSAKITGTRITCWDSMNHSYHSPLSKLGESIGYPKIESDYGWTRGLKLTDKDIEYAVRDVEIVQRYMEAQQELYSAIGAEMKTTTPATALDFWRRRFLKESIAAVSKPVRRFFKQGYYGGRVEIFTMKAKGPITYVDINSLYPSVMQCNYPDIDNLKRDGRFGMAEATVDIPQSHVPPLPVRARGKLLFPVGRVRGVWCTCELEYAVTCGVHVLHVHNLIGSRGTVRPFADYVTKCYASRLESKSPLERTMWKLLMNSLYGKFGTDGKAQKLVDPETVPNSERTGREFFIGDLLCVDVETEPAAYANILWAAWTTALARIRLHRSIQDCLRHGSEPLYCDTDSLIFKSPRRKGRYSFLKLGKKLGEWKVEAEIKEFEALAPKVYQFETEDGITTKAKGVPRDVQERFFSEHTANYRKPLRMREAARRGLDANLWVSTKKTLKSSYDKRTILAHGKTCPPVLSEGE